MIRLSIELLGIFILAYWGAKTGKDIYMKIGLSITAPLFIMIVWGLYGSPKARFPLPKLIHLLFELIIFGLPMLVLYTLWFKSFAIGFVILFIINRVLLFVWKQ